MALTCSLVHLRAAQKPTSDVKTVTYVILFPGLGPGSRWFKRIRPDHSRFLPFVDLRCVCYVLNTSRELRVSRTQFPITLLTVKWNLTIPHSRSASFYLARRGLLPTR